MHKIDKILRKDYIGEDVNLVGTLKESAWTYETEFVDNPFKNGPMSNHAVVIGNGTSRLGFDLRYIMDYVNHPVDQTWKKARISKKFFTYGCNALHRDFAPDFLVVTGDKMIREVATSPYTKDHIAYANNSAVMEWQGRYHVIPQDPPWNSGTVAAYLAVFDGHKKIFLLGFDNNDTTGHNYNVYADTPCYPKLESSVVENFWIESMSVLMTTYPDVEFVRVAPNANFTTPEAWKYFVNFRTIDFNRFALEADL
jgi:hypothetical protein